MRGSVNLINRFRPLVTFEFGKSSYAAYSVIPEQVFAFWKENGYIIFDILDDGSDLKLIKSTEWRLSDIHDYVKAPRDFALIGYKP